METRNVKLSTCFPGSTGSKHRGRNDVRMVITRLFVLISSCSLFFYQEERKKDRKWKWKVLSRNGEKERHEIDYGFPGRSILADPGNQVASSFELEYPELATGFGLTRCLFSLGACGVRASSRAILSLPWSERVRRHEQK